MVQTYGAVPDGGIEPVNIISGDREDAALLGGDGTIKRAGKAEGHATIVSCISNLANTIIGSGAYTAMGS